MLMYKSSSCWKSDWCHLQWTEFLLFAALLVAVSIIFSIMAYFYTYVDPDQLAKLTKEDNNMADLKEKEKENMDMIDVPKSTKM